MSDVICYEDLLTALVYDERDCLSQSYGVVLRSLECRCVNLNSNDDCIYVKLLNYVQCSNTIIAAPNYGTEFGLATASLLIAVLLAGFCLSRPSKAPSEALLAGTEHQNDAYQSMDDSNVKHNIQ